MKDNKSQNYCAQLRNDEFKDNLSYIQKVGRNSLSYLTIGQQLSIVARDYGDQEAFVFFGENKRFTYKQLLNEADHLAAGLKCLGLEKGDRVCFLAHNVSTWPIVLYAAARAGLIVLPLNPTYDADEIAFCLNKVSAKALIMSEKFSCSKYFNKLLEIIPDLSTCNPEAIKNKRCPDLSTIIIDSEKHFPGALRLKDITNLPTTYQVRLIEEQQVHISPDCGFNIQYTSGFTGKSKAVLLRHFSLLNTGFNLGRLHINNTRICIPLPFCHVYSLNIIMLALCYHGTIIVPSSIDDPEKTLSAIYQEECEIVFGMPKMFMDLMAKQLELKLDIKKLIGVFGGGQCSKDLYYEIKEVLGLDKLLMLLGITESGGINFISYPNDADDEIIGTVGCIMDHVEAKVIDTDGKIVSFGTPGELCLRGYLIMKCYWGDQEKTKKSLEPDGWLRTGDYFILESNGYGRIIGRMAEIITKGTKKIFPRDIENLLASFDRIAEVYVVSVPDEILGEELCAFVRLRSGFNSISSQDIFDFCNGKISSSEIPRYVQVVKDFPKTLGGKVKKLDLKKQFSCKN